MAGFAESSELDSHQRACSQFSPALSFFPTSVRHTFEAGKKQFISYAVSALDIEARKTSSSISFGPQSRNEGELTPISVGWNTKFLIHADSFPVNYAKTLIGADCLQRMFQCLQFETFYIFSVIQRNARPMRPLTDNERLEASRANRCGNCSIWMSKDQSCANHCHSTSGCYTGQICRRCNAAFRKNEVLKMFLHGFSYFDSKLILSALDSKAGRERVKTIKAFAKGGENCMKIDLEYRCLACFEQDLPKSVPDFAVLKGRSAEMKSIYQREFDERLEIVKREIQIQKDLVAMENEEDQEDEEEEVEEEGGNEGASWRELTREFESATASPEEFDWRTKPCPHKRGWAGRRLVMADSNLLIRSSLAKASDDLVTSALQPTRCAFYPEGPPGAHPSSRIWLGERKDCPCCVNLSPILEEAPEVIDYADRMMGDSKHTELLLKKLQNFPYSILDEDLEELNKSTTFPSREKFVNQLQDGKEIDIESYQSLKEDCERANIADPMSLLITYQNVDVISLLLLLQFSYKFVFRHFGLNILRYISISKLAFDIVLRHATATVGEGLEYVSSYRLYNFFKSSLQGGFSQATQYGRMFVSNFKYSSKFKPSKPQTLYCLLDKTR